MKDRQIRSNRAEEGIVNFLAEPKGRKARGKGLSEYGKARRKMGGVTSELPRTPTTPNRK